MIKTIFPSKDATLYEHTASMNTGLDPILEIRKDISGSGGDLMRSRAVIQFDTSTISASLSEQGINTGTDSGTLKYFLKMFISKEEDVPAEYSIVIHPIREAWDMGTGKFTSDPIVTNGCSWTNKAPEQAWTDTGGYFFTGSAISESAIQTFTNVAGDIDLDVTDMVEAIHSGIKNNFGFIIKRSGSQETNSTEYGSLAYYSRETNTIYSPRLEARYIDNSTAFTTVTGSAVSVNDIIAVRPRLQPEYKQGDITRIFVDVDKQYSARSQVGAVGTTFKYYLPISSSYAIKDVSTGEYVYNHDANYTQIGRTGNTLNYFDLDTNGLFPERYYCVEFKVNYYSGINVVATKHYKPELYFKVRK